jgi:hypothetical protein
MSQNKSLASTGVPEGYSIAYSFGLDRWRVILPDERTHWLAPGADKHAARRWAHAHAKGIAHGLCSVPGPDPARVPKRVEGDDLDAVLKQIREEAQR